MSDELEKLESLKRLLAVWQADVEDAIRAAQAGGGGGAITGGVIEQWQKDMAILSKSMSGEMAANMPEEQVEEDEEESESEEYPYWPYDREIPGEYRFGASFSSIGQARSYARPIRFLGPTIAFNYETGLYDVWYGTS